MLDPPDHLVQPVHLDRLDQLDLKAKLATLLPLLEPLALTVNLAPMGLQELLVLKVSLVHLETMELLVPLEHLEKMAWMVLQVPQVLLVLQVQLGHQEPMVKMEPLESDYLVKMG